MTVSARTLGFMTALVVSACHSPRPSLPPAPAQAVDSASPSPAVAAPAPPPAVAAVEPADALLPLGEYRSRFEGLLVGERQQLLVSALDGAGRPPIGHAVVTVANASGGPPFRMVTVGFGRRPQPHAFGTTPRYVELMAESYRDDEAVRELLSSLGQLLHSADRPISVRFQAFETIRTDEPIFGERYFVLVPGQLRSAGDLVVDDELRVTVLQVIPVDEADFIHMNMRGDGAVRAWWASHRGSSELLHRWDDVASTM